MLLGIKLALGIAAQSPPATVAPVAAGGDTQELALARQVAAAVVPPGALGKRMQLRFRAFVTAGMVPSAPARSSNPEEKGFFNELRKTSQDPVFAERMRITTRILNQAGLEAAADIEPLYREAVAKALTRRLTAAQLSDVLAFVVTPSGRAFAGQVINMEDQPEVIAAGKELMARSMQRMVAAQGRIRQATEHLPPMRDGAGTPTPRP